MTSRAREGNDWNDFGCGISESVVEAQADAMVSSGLAAAGYQYINIDDCWQGGRNADGTIYPDATKFPNGLKVVADYVHSKGLKFGLYTDAGPKTCSNFEGSGGPETQDAQTWASWGVDYVKDEKVERPGRCAATRPTPPWNDPYRERRIG